MLSKAEALASLFDPKFQNKREELDFLSNTLAHSSKDDRRNLVKSEENDLKKFVSAAIEITRFWKGFCCR